MFSLTFFTFRCSFHTHVCISNTLYSYKRSNSTCFKFHKFLRDFYCLQFPSWCPIFKSSYFNSLQDRTHVYLICGCPIFKRVVDSWLINRGTWIKDPAMAAWWNVPFASSRNNGSLWLLKSGKWPLWIWSWRHSKWQTRLVSASVC